MKIHLFLALLSPSLLHSATMVAAEPFQSLVGSGGNSNVAGGAAAATCPGFTAADTSGLGAFSKINIGVNCPKGGGANIPKPSAVNWKVSAVDGSALKVSMTPANLFTMEVENNELSFYLVPANWPGSGDAGVEIVYPAGQVTAIDVGGQNQGADLRLGRTPVSVGVDGQGSRAVLASMSAVALSVNGQSNEVSATAPSFSNLAVDGQSNAVGVTGNVAKGTVDGMSNRLLIVGEVSNVLVDGMSNSVALNGGDCRVGVRPAGRGMSNSCAPSTDTVTAPTIGCTAKNPVGRNSVCGGSGASAGGGVAKGSAGAHTRAMSSGGEGGAATNGGSSLFLGMIPFVAASVYLARNI